MGIWYCLECGDYSFSQPEKRSEGWRGVWDCAVCRLPGVVDLSERKTGLRAFAAETAKSHPTGRFDDLRPQYRPLNYLADALAKSKLFIHVGTESIDGFFLGMLALKQASWDVEQRVILWHPNRMYQNLRNLMDHSAIVKGYEHGEYALTRGLLVTTISDYHQKLIVIDGEIAFKGSANASLDGWTKQGNMIEFVTDRREIQQLNRQYFACYLAKKRGSGE